MRYFAESEQAARERRRIMEYGMSDVGAAQNKSRETSFSRRNIACAVRV
jgi:hypothetical protein